MSRESVMKAIEETNKVYSIIITGDERNKNDAFYILMNTQQLVSTEKETFHGINNNTRLLLKEAEIEFEVIER